MKSKYLLYVLLIGMLFSFLGSLLRINHVSFANLFLSIGLFLNLLFFVLLVVFIIKKRKEITHLFKK